MGAKIGFLFIAIQVSVATAFVFYSSRRCGPQLHTFRQKEHQLRSVVTPSSVSSKELIPEENPDFDPTRTSLAGIKYVDVLNGLHELYPPTELQMRNAASRTDGYWPFINKGEEPPKKFTYGEFDFFFFAELLDKAHEHYFEGTAVDRPETFDGCTFVDIGSGAGRLVVAAAALHPGFRLCKGIEILPSINQIAEEKLFQCRSDRKNKEETEEQEEEWVSVDSGLYLKSDNPTDEAVIEEEETSGEPERFLLPQGNNEVGLKLAPIEFNCGSFDDPYQYYGDANVVFVFSSCMSEVLMQSLSESIGRQCKKGTIIITTEFPLQLLGQVPPHQDPRVPSGKYELELVESVDGYVWLTGGVSTAFIHRVKESLWTEQRLERPKLSRAEQAFEALRQSDQLDGKAFIRDIRNHMIFRGYPNHWLPDTEVEIEHVKYIDEYYYEEKSRS